ncbi:hypothetical protein LCGC14_1593640 [marine sediment metagenome]|uniref:Uncharacterized protein n=1 Tax=marine sediment metagenome TaxID=412755 RepID=A0A0F9IZM8_9ZZZZ
MTEQEIVRMIQKEEAYHTDFNATYWDKVDSATLQSCYDKGFLRWNNDKLVVTPLGKRSCGG